MDALRKQKKMTTKNNTLRNRLQSGKAKINKD